MVKANFPARTMRRLWDNFRKLLRIGIQDVGGVRLNSEYRRLIRWFRHFLQTKFLLHLVKLRRDDRLYGLLTARKQIVQWQEMEILV